MGLRGSDTAAISLDDVEVADDADARRGRRRLQGRDERAGLRALQRRRRLRRASARAASTSRSRTPRSASSSAGRSRRFQLVQAMLAEMARARPTPRGCSSGAPGCLKDAGKPNTTETSIAKLFATEAAVQCANTAIQVHGGSGYVDDHPVERYFRDVRVTTLYEGTSQIQKLIIGRAADRASTRSSRPEWPRAAARADRRRRRRDDGRGHRPARLRWPARATLLHDPIPEALERGVERVARAACDARRRARALSAERARRARERCSRPTRSTTSRRASSSSRPRPSGSSSSASCSRALAGGRAPTTACWPRTPRRSRSPRSPPRRPTPSASSGMHFFNPAPVMELVEVVAGEQSGEAALALARAAGEAMGKRVIDAADGPGFLVNRCNRPFGLEALRLLAERRRRRRADRPHLPPRRRLPHGPVRAQGPRRHRRRLRGRAVVLRAELRRAALAPLAAHRADGRRRPARPQDRPRLVRLRGRPAPAGGPRRRPSAGGGDGRLVVVAGDAVLARELRAAAAARAGTSRAPEEAGGEVPFLILDCGAERERGRRSRAAPQAMLLRRRARSRRSTRRRRGRASTRCRRSSTRLVELTRGPDTRDAGGRARPSASSRALGLHVAWVGDAPGLVLGRIVASSSTRRRSRSARASAAPRTSTPAWCSASTTRAGRSAWARRDRPRPRARGARRAARRAPRGALPRRAAAAPARCSGRLGQPTGEGFFRHHG